MRRSVLMPQSVALCALIGGCSTPDRPAIDPGAGAPTYEQFRIGEPMPSVEIIARQTLEGVGAAQGVAVRGGYVYVFGDAETGVIREYTFDTSGPRLEYTGRTVALTLGGKNLLPHPTGLAFSDEHPALIGDTVGGVGTMFWIDFDRALADGDLDEAVIRRIDDDLASDGCRPEFIEYNGNTVVVTSDHDATPNELRIYDVRALRTARRTSDPGVLVASWRCGPFVESIRWTRQENACLLVQNQIRGLRYRLTLAHLDPTRERVEARVHNMAEPGDELEGFVMLTPEVGVMVSAMRDQNATFVRVSR